MAKRGVERRLAAILSADVVGYSRMMGVDEAGTLAALKAHRVEFVDPTIAEYQGRIVKLMGDGALVEFPSVVDAVECAVALQRGMAARGAEQPEDRRIDFRIGVNLGDVIVDGDDIYGDGVNVAARLQEIAEPGGVCISGSVFEQVKGKTNVAFDDMGAQSVKNIAEPVRVYRVSSSDREIGVMAHATEESPPPETSSIAVLPFVNMSGDAEQEYFSDGITEDIITELSRFKNLLVIARNSSFTFKGTAVDVKEIRRKLGVAYVVEGSVRKAGNRVRITAQLVDTRSAAHLWAERFDRELEDIFAVQDEVVASVAANLGRSLHDDAVARARSRPTASLSAYDYLLRGRAAFWSDNHREAFEYVEKALAADPNYAAAHAWLALQYTYQGFSGTMGWSVEEVAIKAHEHAEIALGLNDRDVLVQMAAGMAFMFTLGGDQHRALRHSDAAVALNPHDPEGMYCRAYVLMHHGRHAEAWEWLERLRRLNPVISHFPAQGLLDFYFSKGEYQNALDAYRGVGEVPVHLLLAFAACYAELGQMEEVSSHLAKFERRRPATFDAQAYARLGIDMRVRQVDRERVRDAYRKAGLLD